MPRDQINIRCGMDLKMILLQKDNYSEFCRDAILEKLDRENDSLYIDSKIKEYQKIINEFQMKKQNIPTVDNTKIKEKLEQWYQRFNEWKTDETEDYMASAWIRNNVIPDLKKMGCKTLDSKTILNMFLSGKINVQ